MILKKVRIFFLNSFFDNIKKKDYFILKEDFKEIIDLSNKLSIDNNAKFYFVYLPIYQRFQLNNNNENFENYKEIIKIVKNLNIPVIDINEELFDNIKDPLILFPFRAPGHYNVKGYELVTKTIFNKINELEK